MRSGVVVIVVRDALTDQRRCGAFASVAVLPALQFIMSAATCISFMVVRCKLSFNSFAFRPVSLCLCVRVCVRVLVQLRLWACLSHVFTYRCAVRFSFSAAAAPAHTLRTPLCLLLRYLCLNTCPSHIDGRATGRLVPAHTHRHCVLGPSRFLQVTDGSCSPGNRLQHNKTGAPSRAATHSSFLW